MQNFSNLVSYTCLLVFGTIMLYASTVGCESNTAFTAGGAAGASGIASGAGIAGGLSGGAGGGLNAR